MFESLSDKLQDIIRKTSGNATLTQENTDEALREIRRALLASDVSLIVVKAFISRIKDEIIGRDVLKSVNPSQMLVKIVHDELTKLLGFEKAELKLDTNPSLIMFLGLQGSGKTTSCAKLALKLKNEGKKPLILACDIYRPAAIKQLETLCVDNNIDVFKIDNCTDVLKIVDEGLKFAKENNNTVVIIDTAGRLQIDTEMMAELFLINKSYQLNEKLLVIDSMTGQEAVDVAKNFDEQLGLTGVILTKLDGDTRGGAALSVVYTTGKPIKFIGLGEKIEPLEDFYPDRMANRILGMGDIVSLVEKVQKTIDIEETKKLEEKMLKSQFSFDDFLNIQKQIKALGSFGGILKMLPIPGLKNDDIDTISHEGDKQFKRIEVMISSMTPEERMNPNLLNASRKQRIAKGAGVSYEEFNKFILQFEQMRKMMKGLGTLKKGGIPNFKGRMPNFPFK
ncbi:MAG: signal recognition particle protein [Cyanobacteria bacterium SIG30]|nr:signal recognition particle protein [Cyanobacteria bacterium SIG30]